MNELLIKETFCKDEINNILLDPDIYDRMACDIKKGELPNITFDNKKYIGGYINGEIIGICIYCKKPDGNIVHFNVLPEYRYKYAKSFAKGSLKFKYSGPLFAITPERYMPVVNFALKIGFKKYGIHQDYFIKDGKEYKQIITRFE